MKEYDFIIDMLVGDISDFRQLVADATKMFRGKGIPIQSVKWSASWSSKLNANVVQAVGSFWAAA